MTWEKVRLRDLGTWYGGGTPSKSNPDFWTNGDVPWLSPKDMGPEILYDTKDHVTAAAVAGSSTKLVPAGAVAVVTRSGILEHTIPVALVPFATTMNQDMKAVVPRGGVDPRWIAWGLRAFERDLLRHTRKAGTTVASIEMSRWHAFELPVPPLEEQVRILSILEDHLSRLDAANAMLKSSVDRATSLAWRTAGNAVRTAGGQPVELGTLGTFKNGIYVSRPAPEPDGVPILRIGAVRPLALGFSDLRYSKKSESEIRAIDGVLAPGDLVFTRYNGNAELVGSCALVPGDAPLLTYPDKLIRLRFSEQNVVPEFIAIACSVGAARSEIRRFRRTSAGQVGIAGGSLKRVTVRLPDIPTQEESVRIVREAQEATARLATAAEHAQRRSATLRRSLLAAAFAGRLTGSSAKMFEELGMIDK